MPDLSKEMMVRALAYPNGRAPVEPWADAASYIGGNLVKNAGSGLANTLMAPGQALQGGDPTKGLSDESVEASIPKAVGLASLGPMASAPGALAGAGSIDPMLAALYLKRSGRYGTNELGHSWMDSHILDESGKRIGNLSTAFDPATGNVHVESIHTDKRSPFPKFSNAREANDRSHALGPSDIRSLVTALRAEYPAATSMTGYRVSGARDLAGKVDELAARDAAGNEINASIRLPKVPQSAVNQYLQRKAEVEPLYHDPWGEALAQSHR